MIEVANDMEVKCKTIDSKYEITSDSKVEEGTFLVVNGPLKIQAGAEDVLKKYTEIIVNGPVECPRSVAAYLSKVTVNGPINTYPDGSTVLKSSFEIDKYFPLRAKQDAKYYVKNEVIVRDKSVDLQKLVEKNVTFTTKRLIVPECRIEDCIPMFDEQVEFEVIPNEMEMVFGDAKLNEELLTKYGNKLYISGDLKLTEESTEICSQLKKLVVKGKVVLKKEQLEVFEKISAEYDEIEIIKGRQLKNQVSVQISKKLMDHSPEGISIKNVANLRIEEDVTVEDILDKLQIVNCANVYCSEEQKGAIAIAGKNIANINVAGETKKEEETSIGGIIKGVLDAKLINADTYVM